MRIEFDNIFDKIRSLISAKRTEMYENFVIFDMRCLTIFREFAWIPLFISVFWRKTCLHNKSCNKIMAFRPHQLSMAKAIEKKKVTSSSNFSERDIFTPLRTSNPAFISNHYSAKNLGMSSKYTWYKYERRFFFMLDEDITNSCKLRNLGKPTISVLERWENVIHNVKIWESWNQRFHVKW